MRTANITAYRFDKNSGLSIPATIEIVADNSNAFTLDEIASIAKALLYIEPPKQVKKTL